MKGIVVLLVALSLLAGGCRKSDKETLDSDRSLEYARGFRIHKQDGFTEIEVLHPYQGAKSSIKYLLVPREEALPNSKEGFSIIQVPVSRIVCTSTSHIALLDQLNAIDLLVGFPSTDLVSSRKARARIDSGLVKDLGVDNDLNIESLAALTPDLVMSYSITGDAGQLGTLKKLGIPTVVNSEYLEQHPLGRAEWIKFVACFLGKEDIADSIFRSVKNSYFKAKSLVDTIARKPTVITGILYGDTWFLPGGENYASNIFKDAGYNYLWGDDPSHGFLKPSFESVYARARDADFWIGVGSFESLSEMAAAENRYTLFKAFNNSRVYTYNARTGPRGGSEYLELGYARPDIIVMDLIKIAHPELLPEHDPYFHKKLE